MTSPLALRPKTDVLLLGILCAALSAQTPVGSEETYALASDRAKAVATLIPGTEDWYFVTRGSISALMP